MSLSQKPTYEYACSECHRRKQKCNRDWPCASCTKRNVPMLCKYTSDPPSKSEDTTEKGYRCDSLIAVQGIENLRACGLGPSYLQQLGHNIEPIRRLQLISLSSPHPLSALIPTISRNDADFLVQVFTKKVHIHCDIVHLISFVKQYSDWWDARLARGTIDLHWTCLLLEVLACAAQQAFPSEQGSPGKRFHNAAESLYCAICEGNLTSCRTMLSSAWLMTIQLGIHQEPAGSGIDFEIEMKRKIWLYMAEWDLEIAILLSQPRVMDRTCCTVRRPDVWQNLTLQRVVAHIELFRLVFERRDHSRSWLENGIRVWEQELPHDLEYSTEKLQSDGPEGKFHRMYTLVVKVTAHISPLVPRPGMTFVKPEDRSAVIGHCLSLVEFLQDLIELLRVQEIRMLFLSYYIFTSIAILCQAHRLAPDRQLTQVVSEKAQWAYDYLLKSETNSNLAMALIPVLPENVECSQSWASPIEDSEAKHSTESVEMTATTPSMNTESFFDTLRSEELDELAGKWQQGVLSLNEEASEIRSEAYALHKRWESHYTFQKAPAQEKS
ncbi:uncharacterized protein FMAN_15432 [Fusarium mangiferae]|uniref:Zn(2)-C6 fungal-type domain-containing protein n=1 Tax=Fusarium mangiferae TaxID=192010 RepID=A0A1L7UL18_FUSMA|nr:uncharacterized protein FMAN_15432 [Fusarium mangiferae]CVL09153.1 uncharacterized protein FMAN_15432 [Fusarium mangiferae]